VAIDPHPIVLILNKSLKLSLAPIQVTLTLAGSVSHLSTFFLAENWLVADLHPLFD
jgi:hypothetical protein